MLRRPSRSTLTDTLCPYTWLFRSELARHKAGRAARRDNSVETVSVGDGELVAPEDVQQLVSTLSARMTVTDTAPRERSEERRVGKECVSTCRSRWSPYH